MDFFASKLSGPKSRQKLLLAGVECVAEKGIDSVAASDVITRAGVSRPTFYSYFDDIAGLMAEAWILVGREWFSRLIDFSLPDNFENSATHTALMDVLMSTSRTPELREVVLPDIAAEWDTIAKCPPPRQVGVSWGLATSLGISASKVLMPEVVLLHDLARALAEIPEDFVISPEAQRITYAVEPVVTEPEISADDEISTRLLQSVIKVVATSGVSRASMTRVSRAARVTTGSSKPRFHTLENLMTEGFDYAIREVTRQNTQQTDSVFGNVSPIQAYARLVVSSLHPTRRQWRRYRQEMHLAARTNPFIADHMRRQLHETNMVLENTLRSAHVDESIIQISLMVNQAQGIGFSLLDDLEVPVRDLNHAFIPEWIPVSRFASFAP